MALGSVRQLQARDFEAALRVVDAASRAHTLDGFREATLEAMASAMGYRDATFFVGATVEEAFADRRPAVSGRAGRMLEQYVGRWWREDLYARPRALQLFRRRSVVALRELPRPAGPGERRYVEQFLVANRIEDELGVRLDTGACGVALMGVLGDGRRPFDARDVARLELLSGPLSSILRFYLRPERRAREAELSPREREVAELVAAGLSNREVARELCVGEHTVKKHLTRVLAATGCRSRTHLAAAWRGDGLTPAGSHAPAAAPAPRGPSPA